MYDIKFIYFFQNVPIKTKYKKKYLEYIHTRIMFVTLF